MDQIFSPKTPVAERAAMLNDNADGVEFMSYMKPYTQDDIQGMKESLATVSIEINDIEEEKKEAVKGYKDLLEPKMEDKKMLLKGIKEKAVLVREECYKMTDRAERCTGFYNSEGILVASRPATSDELGGTVFALLREGTNN